MPTENPPVIRCLTVRQPWAFAIGEGFKTVENRTRRTKYRGTVLIHAGQTFDGSINLVKYSRDAAIRLDQLGGRSNFWDARFLVPSKVYAPPAAALALSAVIGSARITGCHQATNGCCAPWGFPDSWHWELADVVPLPKAVPSRGALGLWKPTAELLEAVVAQTRDAADLVEAEVRALRAIREA